MLSMILVMIALFLLGFFYGYFVRDLVDRIKEKKKKK